MNEKKISNRITVSSPDMESHTGNASLGKKEIKGFNRPVSIKIHSFRKRLTDSDGACSKYVLDAIVSAGILIDDSPEYVPESPKKTQGKAKEEKTIVTIEEV